MLIGHEDVQQDFSRLVQNGRLGHAYLFFGPAAVGKFSLALELAAYLERGLSSQISSPSQVLPSKIREGKKKTREGKWPGKDDTRPLTDATAVLPDESGTVGIDAARSVRAFLSARPFLSSRRTAIIDRAETLTDEAQNALLKIAEEPPSAGLLLLVSTSPELLRGTLVSRFQRVFLGAVRKEKIVAWLTANGVPRSKAAAAAAESGGKPGLAWRLAAGQKTETEEAARKFLHTAAPGRKDFLKGLLENEGFNLREFLDALILLSAPAARTNGALWHAMLELRAVAEATGVNPRLQLMHLGTYL